MEQHELLTTTKKLLEAVELLDRFYSEGEAEDRFFADEFYDEARDVIVGAEIDIEADEA